MEIPIALSGFLYFRTMSFSIVLYDRSSERNKLLPLVATRPVGNLRVGAYTLNDKWAKLFHTDVSYLTEDHLAGKYPYTPTQDLVLLVNAHILPEVSLLEKLKTLQVGQRLIGAEGQWIALLTTKQAAEDLEQCITDLNYDIVLYEQKTIVLQELEDIFVTNGAQISFDAALFYMDRLNKLQSHDYVVEGEKLYISSSAAIAKGTYLNALQGPIIIEDNAVIEPGCVIHGPCVIGNNVRVKSGTILYPNVTVGDHSTVCGELNNTVIWGNSAKGHYGYLGCAVLGEGCNLGAGTTNSNLQNNWGEIKVYSYAAHDFRNTGLKKCGVFIGDYSMLAIQSKITTGTVLGVGVQVAISNFIPKFVPDFTWMSEHRTTSYILEKFMDMLERKSSMKGEMLTKEDKAILSAVYEKTEYLRNY